jgi:hypothetical protein
VGPAADIALVAGAVSAANEAVFAPLAGEHVSFNWRIIPATAVFALLAEGLSLINSELALAVTVTALITVLFVPVGNAGSPVVNLSKALGYQK